MQVNYLHIFFLDNVEVIPLYNEEDFITPEDRDPIINYSKFITTTNVNFVCVYFCAYFTTSALIYTNVIKVNSILHKNIGKFVINI